MESLHYLKYTYDLSDEGVCEGWSLDATVDQLLGNWATKPYRHNALLSAAGMNFAKLLKHMAKLWHEYLQTGIGKIFANEPRQTSFHLLCAA